MIFKKIHSYFYDALVAINDLMLAHIKKLLTENGNVVETNTNYNINYNVSVHVYNDYGDELQSIETLTLDGDKITFSTIEGTKGNLSGLIVTDVYNVVEWLENINKQTEC